jgi:hypothetical protein
MKGIGILLIVGAFIFGGGAVLNAIVGVEMSYFTLNVSLNIGVFLAVLGTGLLIIEILERILGELKRNFHTDVELNSEKEKTQAEVLEETADIQSKDKGTFWIALFSVLFIGVLVIAMIGAVTNLF